MNEKIGKGFITSDMAVETYFVTRAELLRAMRDNRLYHVKIDQNLELYFNEKQVRKHFKSRLGASAGQQIAIAAAGTAASGAMVVTIRKASKLTIFSKAIRAIFSSLLRAR